jgi:hypothetical protein
MRVSSAPPVLDTPARSAPYPDLVASRIAHGWDPERAATEPFAPRAKLTPEIVQTIRTVPRPAQEVAADLGVSARHVRRIRSGISWKGV